MSFPIPKLEWANTEINGVSSLGQNDISFISDTSNLTPGMEIVASGLALASYLDTPPGALGVVELVADNEGEDGNLIQVVGGASGGPQVQEDLNDGVTSYPVGLQFGGANDHRRGGVFVATSSYNLDSIDFYMTRTGGGIYTFTVDLYEATPIPEGFPTTAIGSPIATSSTTYDQSFTAGFKKFDFSGVSIVSGQTYIAVLRGVSGLISAANGPTAYATNNGAQDANSDHSEYFNGTWYTHDRGMNMKVYGSVLSDINTLINDWNLANPTNTASVVQGGSETPNQGEIIALSGGGDATAPGFPVGTTIVSVDTNQIILSNNATQALSGTFGFKFEFKFRYPSIIDNGESVMPKRRVKTSIAGIDQVSIDHIRYERELEFGHLTESERDELQNNFYIFWAIFGKPFRYFPDQNTETYFEYELADGKFEPTRLGNSDKFGFETTFKRVTA